MWELYHKKGWVPKYWCFQHVVLEKTPESPLESKIKPVNLNGNQPCIFIGAPASVFPMNIQGWFPFRIGWFDLLAVQWTLKSLLQHHNLKASILRRSAFFMFQFSHPYMTTGKTMTLTIQIFVSKWCLSLRQFLTVSFFLKCLLFLFLS